MLEESNTQRSAEQDAQRAADEADLAVVQQRVPDADEDGESLPHAAGEPSASASAQESVSSLHAAAEAIETLILCPDQDTLFRQAVELAREKLGLERCSLYLLDTTGSHPKLFGTYGTDIHGHLMDEHGVSFFAPIRWKGIRDPARPEGLYQVYEGRELTGMENGELVSYGMGWIGTTPVQSASRVVGIFFNDTAISHAPPNQAQQETLAVYCSLLGAIIERQQAEEAHRQLEAERKRLEEQLAQAHKMESIGRLAGGVAHDFNNLLTAILGYNELAAEEADPDSSLALYLENIRKAAERAANLTQQLLAFARKQILEPKVVSLNDLMLEVDTLLRRLIGEDIELLTLPAPDLWPVRVDPGQMEQVMLNLAVNARDAMPGGGKLTIETQNVVLDAEEAQRHADLMPGEYVLLAIRDTGEGMTEEVKARLFEPFFTTKGPGKGTGLGLATCYGIVKQNDGHIRIESELGQGTTFRIYLPRVETPLDTAVAQDSLTNLPRGTETILLVEDEELVRAIAVQTLRAQGYVVREASNGNEALRWAQEFGAAPNLLITDVVMPQMSGKELAERLSALHPDLKVLYMSGYTDNAIVHHGALDPGVLFLAKPFTPPALARHVREILDESGH